MTNYNNMNNKLNETLIDSAETICLVTSSNNKYT